MTLANKNPQIKKAVGVLKELSEDERLRMIEDLHEKARRDAYAREKYVQEEAREKGREEGREEGRVSKAYEIAHNLLAMNLSAQEISKATMLTIDEIEKLQQ